MNEPNGLTVRELIKLLEQYPPDMPVYANWETYRFEPLRWDRVGIMGGSALPQTSLVFDVGGY